MALRSCKLVKFFIQNLTGECVYLIEVPAYFAAVRFRINIAHDFLRETLKEIQQRWTSDTCQLSCLPWCWRCFEFQRVESVKVTSCLFKKTILRSQESIPKLPLADPSPLAFLSKGLHSSSGSRSAEDTCWKQHGSLRALTSATSDPAPGTHWLPSLCSITSSFLFPPSK